MNLQSPGLYFVFLLLCVVSILGLFEEMLWVRPIKNSVFRVRGLKILGRGGPHIFNYFFFLKSI